MRCVDVIRELAVPTDHLRASGVEEHLARCPRCAAWAEGNARLDRVWDATRPPALAPAEIERLWANVSAALDRRESAVPALKLAPAPTSDPSPVLPPSRPWRRVALRGFACAQAAVLLIGCALVLKYHGDPQRPATESEIAVASPLASVSIDQQQTVVISFGQGVKVRDDLANNDNGVDPLYSMFNAVEALAALQ